VPVFGRFHRFPLLSTARRLAERGVAAYNWLMRHTSFRSFRGPVLREPYPGWYRRKSFVGLWPFDDGWKMAEQCVREEELTQETTLTGIPARVRSYCITHFLAAVGGINSHYVPLGMTGISTTTECGVSLHEDHCISRTYLQGSHCQLLESTAVKKNARDSRLSLSASYARSAARSRSTLHGMSRTNCRRTTTARQECLREPSLRVLGCWVQCPRLSRLVCVVRQVG
jgi:hypothetical protein